MFSPTSPGAKTLHGFLGCVVRKCCSTDPAKKLLKKGGNNTPSFNPNQQDKHVPKGSETNCTRTTLCHKDAFTAAHFLIQVPQNKERPCHQEKLSLRGGVQPGSLPWLRRFMFWIEACKLTAPPCHADRLGALRLSQIPRRARQGEKVVVLVQACWLGALVRQRSTSVEESIRIHQRACAVTGKGLQTTVPCDWLTQKWVWIYVEVVGCSQIAVLID